MPIRPATEADLPAITAIFNEVIATSTAIYADDPVSLEDRASWFAQRRAAGYPVLVADDGDGVATRRRRHPAAVPHAVVTGSEAPQRLVVPTERRDGVFVSAVCSRRIYAIAVQDRHGATSCDAVRELGNLRCYDRLAWE
jgi:hypothetical protein